MTVPTPPRPAPPGPRETFQAFDQADPRHLEAGPAVRLSEDEACRTLTRWSGVLVTPGESAQSLTARHREARAAAHPDRHGGDRSNGDAVEAAAKALGVLS